VTLFATVLALLPAAFLPGGQAIVAVSVGLILASLGMGLLARQQIGGYTGDVLGASVQVTEILSLLILLAVLGGS
jgi:adenosylcobinamide-GDP ribazoletransferase